MSENSAGIPYTITFEDYPKYLYALVHGEQYGYDVLAGFLREIADECVKRGFNRALIEENISATASQDDVFRIASELPQLGFSEIRLAYIDRFSEQKEINEYGREVAEDRGVDVRIFTNLEDADRWLSAESE